MNDMISVIVSTYNREDALDAVLRALSRQSDRNFEIVVADDGSGNPSPSFIQQVTNAAYAVRPLGIPCSVFLPVILWASVTMQITTAKSFDHNTVVSQVSAALATSARATLSSSFFRSSASGGVPSTLHSTTSATVTGRTRSPGRCSWGATRESRCPG